MGLFSRNKQIVSDEYADCLNKIVKLSSDVQLLAKDMEILKTNMHSVRGLINRKMGKYEEEESEEEPLTLAEVQKRLMGLGNGKE